MSTLLFCGRRPTPVRLRIRRLAVVTFLLVNGAVCFGSTLAAQQSSSNGLRVIVIDGDEAANIVAERIAAEPVVEVRDREDRKVTGAVVRFFIRRTVRNRIAALFSNGQSEATTLTDSVGRAQASSINPLEPGSFQIDVEVSYQGQTAQASIRHTNYATKADAQSAGSQPAQSAGAAVGASAGAQAAAAAGGGLSKLAVLGIVAGGAAGGGAAAILSRRNSDPAPGRVTAVTSSATNGLQAGTAFAFSVQTTDFDAGSLTYQWDFGDGGVSSESAPTHVYQSTGTFLVAVTVRDARQSARSEMSVTVHSTNGTWLGTVGVVAVTLELSQSGSTISGVESASSYVCSLSGSVGQGTPAVVITVPLCPSPGFLPQAAHEYRLDLTPDGQALRGTVTYFSAGNSFLQSVVVHR
jgi:hypothetical protein